MRRFLEKKKKAERREYKGEQINEWFKKQQCIGQ